MMINAFLGGALNVEGMSAAVEPTHLAPARQAVMIPPPSRRKEEICDCGKQNYYDTSASSSSISLGDRSRGPHSLRWIGTGRKGKSR